MMRIAMVLAIGLLADSGLHGRAAAQQTCNASTQSDWLTSRPWTGGETSEIDRRLVHPVETGLDSAIAMLAVEDAAELTADDLSRFGVAAADEAGLRPYLVRAVFPTANPYLTAAWSGDTLHVFAAGLGCFPFAKHPVVVFLPRRPTGVRVGASAAL